MMMYKTIIWDLDGTLIDSKEDILYALSQSINLANVAPYEQKKDFKIGPPLKAIIRNAYPKITQQKIDEISDFYRQLYDNSNFEKTFLFEGIKDILTYFKNIKHHIITNKPIIPTMRILNKLNIENLFTSIHSTQQKNDKTINKIDAIREFLTASDVNAKNCLCIGDSISDIEAGNANKIMTIGVTWGASNEKELQQANSNLVVTNVYELQSSIKKFISSHENCTNNHYKKNS